MRVMARLDKRYLLLLALAFVLSALLGAAINARGHFLVWDDCFDGVCPENNVWDAGLLHDHSDDMSGRGGNDIIYGDGADDTIRGEAHFDILRGQDAPDVLRSGGGGDDLHGGAGNDHLVGDSDQHNHCWGGGGNDEFDNCHNHEG